jgi:putative membrane protein insertion efficiency factor
MRQILIAVINFYRKVISPILGPRCRYWPSCSKYTLEAVQKYGAAKGTWLGLKRICRCHPWGGHGYDPLP